jgi:hypothetical protein
VPRKSRTPPPPRRVQAPRPRTGDRDREGARRNLYVVIGAAAAVLLAAAVGVALLAFGGSSDARSALEDAGCTVDDNVPIEYARVEGNDARHLSQLPGSQLPEDFEYPTFPPAGGTHHDNQAPLGVYDEPIEQIRIVHNLEHGAVAIQYGRDVPESDVNGIVAWYQDDPNGLLVAPLPALSDRIALTAWNAEFADQAGASVASVESENGVLARCPSFDEEAFDAFVGEYGFKGPERFPREQLVPGGG